MLRRALTCVLAILLSVTALLATDSPAQAATVTITNAAG
jgi:ABC-type proline/glycine betaine transport system substrate-binding protein